MLQRSNIKTRELEKLGKALDKSGRFRKKKIEKVLVLHIVSLCPIVAKHKRASVSSTDGNDAPSAEKKRNFLEDIFRVLLHARRILSASYCIGYFIPEDLGEAVNAHETLQVCTYVGCLSRVTILCKSETGHIYLDSTKFNVTHILLNVLYRSS